jgi:hypothetical protein
VKQRRAVKDWLLATLWFRDPSAYTLGEGPIFRQQGKQDSEDDAGVGLGIQSELPEEAVLWSC